MRYLTIVATIAAFLSMAMPGYAQSQQTGTSFANLWVPGVQAGALWVPTRDAWLPGASLRFDVSYSLDVGRPGAGYADRARWEGYLCFGLYGELGPTTDFAFLWTTGLTIALETPASTDRTWMLPYLGFEIGGMTTSYSGTGFVAIPLAGVALYSSPRFSLSMEAGAMLFAAALDRYLGPILRLNAIFVF
jgi:hypothetical protein